MPVQPERPSERAILKEVLDRGKDFPFKVEQVGNPTFINPVGEDRLGSYHDPDARKCITADMEVIEDRIRAGKPLPNFLAAGPRKMLKFDPASVTVAVVTAGGLAPGLNAVVHSIVDRHLKTYGLNTSAGGELLGFREGFKGLYELTDKPADLYLEPGMTEGWLERGGALLGARRFPGPGRTALVDGLVESLHRWDVNILYVIGGDGSLTIAHEIASRAKDIAVVGIPKTMDNDILWVWQSFGFNTAVERAVTVINTMYCEAESTGRVCIVELFGAKSGFVAANAALASRHVDLVLVPEIFMDCTAARSQEMLRDYVTYLTKEVTGKPVRGHGVVVLAEGVGTLLAGQQAKLAGRPVKGDTFVELLRTHLAARLKRRDVEVFTNQPRHNIRATPPTTQDQIYCRRLGALAVDNALAGYTDFMISQWLTEYVLVPLEAVADHQKGLPTDGMFWRQVVASTGQPMILP